MKEFILFTKHAILLLLSAVNAFVRSFSQALILHGKINENTNKPLQPIMVIANHPIRRKQH